MRATEALGMFGAFALGYALTGDTGPAVFAVFSYLLGTLFGRASR